MGVFDSIERKLDSVVSGGFARAFKGDVQPVEIAARLQRELDAEARLLSRDRKLVPNDFLIELSRHDYDRLFPYSRSISDEIAAQLRAYAADQGYVFNGPLTIEYVAADELPTGRFKVSSQAVAGVAANPAASRSSALVVEVNGIRHPLLPPGIVIGRGSEADIRINDPGISRQHARIYVDGSAAAPTLAIEDLGSTNGVTVDGVRAQGRVPLRRGSRIELGTTRLLIRTPVADV